jgi:UDP-N-acetyl-D-glucosamine dehydrogenase
MKKNVCIQGLGFVGSAMAVACARAGTRNGGKPIYNVIGLDLPSGIGLERVGKINKGEFPFGTTDRSLVEQTKLAHEACNLIATTDAEVLNSADIVVVDVHFDVGDLKGAGSLDFGPFIKAIESVVSRVPSGCLVLIETTVPPGTCEKVIRPVIDSHEEKRGMAKGSILLAHSYERVMPGENYLSSITDFWRVFAGHTSEAGNRCEAFLSTVLNVEKFPLVRLGSTTASETAKVLENSYRAMNIAFMDEWGNFAENVGVDMFEIIKAIKMRPTHNNIMRPGFGVGGYCLTKDPLFADLAGKALFNLNNVDFPLSKAAVKINQNMPLNSLSKVKKALGPLCGKTILLAGISYRQDVADTRYSPSEIFYEVAVSDGAKIICQDPLLDYWSDLNLPIETSLLGCPVGVDAVVFSVPHESYRSIKPEVWLAGQVPYILDASDCLSAEQRRQFSAAGCMVESIGRG